MYPVNVILDLKAKMDIRAYLPRAGIPVVVATIALIGVAVCYMTAKGVLSSIAVEKGTTLMLAAFLGYGVLEFFTAGKRCPSEVINPVAAASTNKVASVIPVNSEYHKADTAREKLEGTNQTCVPTRSAP
jgi:hypothetical protein